MAVTQRARGIDRFLREHQALGSGYYRELSPSPDLRDVAACTWVSVAGPGKFGASTPIIPDGCADIMTYDDGVPHVVGPDTTMRWVPLCDGLVITGLRLRPGALRAVFGCSATTLLDSQARLRDISAVPTRFLDALSHADTLQRRHALLEEWVRRSMAEVSESDRAVLSACRLLSADARLEIGTLARRLGWHARTVHRQFVDACGYGPKHLQRVMRVQAALRAGQESSTVARLPDIAAIAGFADQAHMTREFRDLTGFTPAAYFAAYTPEVGTWLTADWSS
jgi:AraC-like DNA-binding protein